MEVLALFISLLALGFSIGTVNALKAQKGKGGSVEVKKD